MTEKQSRALQDDLQNRLTNKGVYGAAVQVVPAVSKKGSVDVRLGLALELKLLLSFDDFESLLESHKTKRSFLSAVLRNGRVYQLAEVTQAVED